MLTVGLVLISILGAAPATAATHYFPDISEKSVPKARCGPGALAEPGLQGEVSAE
ncbi:hypothetical protein G3I15_50225, partial [Streptomyces sp. SID10244]|nr:hypothetical protein [Streptomyces sp. SID10244]